MRRMKDYIVTFERSAQALDFIKTHLHEDVPRVDVCIMPGTSVRNVRSVFHRIDKDCVVLSVRRV